MTGQEASCRKIQPSGKGWKGRRMSCLLSRREVRDVWDSGSCFLTGKRIRSQIFLSAAIDGRWSWKGVSIIVIATVTYTPVWLSHYSAFQNDAENRNWNFSVAMQDPELSWACGKCHGPHITDHATSLTTMHRTTGAWCDNNRWIGGNSMGQMICVVYFPLACPKSLYYIVEKLCTIDFRDILRVWVHWTYQSLDSEILPHLFHSSRQYEWFLLHCTWTNRMHWSDIIWIWQHILKFIVVNDTTGSNL